MAFSYQNLSTLAVSDYLSTSEWQTLAKRGLPFGSQLHGDLALVAFLAAVDECVNPGPSFQVEVVECSGTNNGAFEPFPLTFQFNETVLDELALITDDSNPYNWPLPGPNNYPTFMGVVGSAVFPVKSLGRDYSSGYLAFRAVGAGGFKIGLAFGYKLFE